MTENYRIRNMIWKCEAELSITWQNLPLNGKPRYEGNATKEIISIHTSLQSFVVVSVPVIFLSSSLPLSHGNMNSKLEPWLLWMFGRLLVLLIASPWYPSSGTNSSILLFRREEFSVSCAGIWLCEIWSSRWQSLPPGMLWFGDCIFFPCKDCAFSSFDKLHSSFLDGLWDCSLMGHGVITFLKGLYLKHYIKLRISNFISIQKNAKTIISMAKWP